MTNISLTNTDVIKKNEKLIANIIESLKDFLPTLVFAIIVLIAGIIFSKICLKLLSKGLDRSKLEKTSHGFFKSLVKVVLYTLVAIIVLSILGIPMTSIIAIVGTAGLAIGLALQSSMSNLAGGFIILFSKPFKVGDYIETNSTSGTVSAITILYTRLLTIDNKAVYIPNGQITTSTVVNYNQENIRRLDLTFSISYDNDFNKAKQVIAEVVRKNNKSLLTPEPLIRVSEQASSSINIACRVWVKSEDYWDLCFDLNESVKMAFDENNITIPYNQLDVNVINK